MKDEGKMVAVRELVNDLGGLCAERTWPFSLRRAGS